MESHMGQEKTFFAEEQKGETEFLKFGEKSFDGVGNPKNRRVSDKGPGRRNEAGKRELDPRSPRK